ncbi:MAG: hypothetical protein ACJA1Q_003268 [Pseudohongiellaceae bacterium]|jgi:hypothetical protein
MSSIFYCVSLFLLFFAYSMDVFVPPFCSYLAAIIGINQGLWKPISAIAMSLSLATEKSK